VDLGEPVVVAARDGGGEPVMKGAGGGLPAVVQGRDRKSQQDGARSEGRSWRLLLLHRGGGGQAAVELIPPVFIKFTKSCQNLAEIRLERCVYSKFHRNQLPTILADNLAGFV
jgi:hypothetical protein